MMNTFSIQPREYEGRFDRHRAAYIGLSPYQHVLAKLGFQFLEKNSDKYRSLVRTRLYVLSFTILYLPLCTLLCTATCTDNDQLRNWISQHLSWYSNITRHTDLMFNVNIHVHVHVLRVLYNLMTVMEVLICCWWQIKYGIDGWTRWHMKTYPYWGW